MLSAPAARKPPCSQKSQGEHIQVSGEVYGLEADTEYSACLIATDSSGETIGQTLRFTTDPAAPKPPQTSTAVDVTTDSAMLEGKLGPQPIATSWYFQYAPQFICTWEHAITTSEQQDTKPGEVDEVSTAVTGLQPGTYYHVCLDAKNGIGATTGSEASFTTESTAPKVESVSAQSTSSEAVIEARTSPDAQTATCQVQYGGSEAYGSTVPCKEGLGNNGERVLASANVTGLEAATTYYYRVVVENQIGKSSPSEGTGTVTTQPAGETAGGEKIKEEKPAEKSTPSNPITSTLSTTPAWWLPTTPPSEPEPKPPKAKPLTRAQKLAKALKACKREKNSRKRTACMKGARRSYGARKAKGKQKT